MSDFFERDERKATSFQKVVYMPAEPGQYTIRILQPSAKKLHIHWIGGSIECLGEDCPQCAQNKALILEAGDFKTATKMSGFSSRQERGAVNVLDRTLVKVCPGCQTEVHTVNGIYPNVCKACGQLLTNVVPTPSNKVKVLAKSASLFAQLSDLNKTVLDAEGNPRGITNFDITLHIVGNTTVAVPTQTVDPVVVPDEYLFDLDNTTIKLSSEEMSQRMRGVSIKDIFAARKAQATVKAETTNPDVQKSLDELFAE